MTNTEEWFVIYTSLQINTHSTLDKVKLKISYVCPSYCSHTFAVTE